MTLASSGDYANVHVVGADFTEVLSKLGTEQESPNKLKLPQDFIVFQFAKATSESKLGN